MTIPVELVAVAFGFVLTAFWRFVREMRATQRTVAEIADKLGLDYSSDTQHFIRRHQRKRNP